MELNKSVRLPHSAITKATGLLPMLYSINELCIELDVPRHLIRLWIQAGLPHHRDQRKHIWINGEECLLWIKVCRINQKQKKILKEDQAHCFRCKKNITIMNPQTVTERGNRRVIGQCPICTCSVNKGVKNDRSEQLQNDTGIPSVQR